MSDARHQGPAAALRRIRLVARHTLGEALHLRLTLVLVLAGAALVGGSLGLRDFNFGSAELKFIADFGLGALGLFGTLLAALATAQLFFRDLETRAAYCVLTRPVRRWEYLAGKFVGAAGLLALFTVTLGLLLAGLLVWRGAQLGAEPFGLRVFLCACAVSWLKSSLVAAMTLLVCSYAGSALFASCTGLLLALVGQLRTFPGGDGWTWLRVWPNLALFDAESLLASGQAPAGAWLLGLAAYWAAYVLLFGVIASYVFKRREL
jgi:ABC-type transport system involved in multi-copper enzyme maturation permease subunit